MKHRRNGFSLIELAVTLVILGILLAVGIPVYTRNKSNATLRATVDQLKSDIEFAKSSAGQFFVPLPDGAPFKSTLKTFILPSVLPGSLVNAAPPPAPPFTVYSIVGVSTNLGTPQQLLRQVGFDSSFTATLQGASDSSVLQSNAGAAVVFGSAGTSALMFGQNGTTVDNSSPTIRITNNITQFRIDVSRLGTVTITEEAVGTGGTSSTSSGP